MIVNGTLSSSQLSSFAGDMLYLIFVAAALTVLGYLAARRALKAE